MVGLRGCPVGGGVSVDVKKNLSFVKIKKKKKNFFFGGGGGVGFGGVRVDVNREVKFCEN